MSIEIVSMNRQHIDGIMKIEHSSFAIPWSKQSFIDELSNDMAIYFVALDKNIPIAYAGLWKVLNEGNITNIAVLPEYRCKGIGSKMIKQLIKVSVLNKLDLLTLEVRETNQPAIYLYKKYGFEIIGKRKRYYTDNNEDGLIMTKYL